jgi:hypothetical protein
VRYRNEAEQVLNDLSLFWRDHSDPEPWPVEAARRRANGLTLSMIIGPITCAYSPVDAPGERTAHVGCRLAAKPLPVIGAGL